MESIRELESKLILLEKENLELREKLHEAYEELEKLFINKSLKKIPTNFKITNIDQRYGAAEIIKKSLPYRLGKTIINDTKSMGNIPKLPFNLLKEYIEFRGQNINNKEIYNLNDYYDYQRALELQGHLSYKVGLCIVDSIEHPLRTPLLPFKVFFEIYRFKYK